MASNRSRSASPPSRRGGVSPHRQATFLPSSSFADNEAAARPASRLSISRPASRLRRNIEQSSSRVDDSSPDRIKLLRRPSEALQHAIKELGIPHNDTTAQYNLALLEELFINRSEQEAHESFASFAKRMLAEGARSRTPSPMRDRSPSPRTPSPPHFVQSRPGSAVSDSFASSAAQFGLPLTTPHGPAPIASSSTYTPSLNRYPDIFETPKSHRHTRPFSAAPYRPLESQIPPLPASVVIRIVPSVPVAFA